MTAYAGETVQLRIGDGASPIESFTAIGGLQVNQLQLQRNAVEANDVADDGWRRLAAGGIRSVRISGQGVFSDSAAEETLRAHAFAGTIANVELEFGNGDVVSGAFMITAYERRGDIAEAENFEVTLESSGTVSVA